MESTVIAVFNITPDGFIVLEGDHSPGTSGPAWGLLGITVVRTGTGEYEVQGPGVAWPAGSRVTIFRDENDQNTVWVKLGTNSQGLTISTRDPDDHSVAVDIVYLMTLRVSVTLVLPDPPVMARAEAEEEAAEEEAAPSE